MTQTNAQRLADELRAELLVDHSSPYKTVNASKRLLDESAIELRRLDAIEQRHNEMLANPCSEWDHKAYQQAIANLRAENAQLRAELEAVRRDAENFWDWADAHMIGCEDCGGIDSPERWRVEHSKGTSFGFSFKGAVTAAIRSRKDEE